MNMATIPIVAVTTMRSRSVSVRSLSSTTRDDAAFEIGQLTGEGAHRFHFLDQIQHAGPSLSTNIPDSMRLRHRLPSLGQHREAALGLPWGY
jgi:hypothetical protein